MPKNVMKLLKPSPHRARNDFDLSHRHVFSINFGELLPSTCIETVPGDHIEMHASDLIRAIPMVTSPFLRAKQHTDVWFVPYHDLWHNFNQFMTSKQEPVSSSLGSASYLPWADLQKLWYYAYDTEEASYDTDVIGFAAHLGTKRILNLLGYGYNPTFAEEAQEYPAVNLFRLAAYNFIWYMEYRQQYYDDGYNLCNAETRQSVSSLWNFDYLTCDTLANAEISTVNYKAMAQMRYRCWKKDLFTGLLPSSQFGSVSTIGSNTSSTISISGVTGNDSARWKDSVGSPVQHNKNVLTYHPTDDISSLYEDGDPAPAQLLHDHTFSGSTSVSVGSFDVLALRKSEAIQIWRENALRAGNHVKDNMMAHYGVESSFRDHRPTFLGSVSSPLNIGDVVTTANGNYTGNTNPNTNVGDVAGKGISTLDDKVFKFDAKDFGVIMAITSILPEAEYNALGVSRPNQLVEQEDFFIPEYENLGLEAVSCANFKVPPRNDFNPVLGYAPRYYGYKTKLDKCYDLFMTGGINAPWCSPKYDVSQILVGQMQSFEMPLSLLYVNPQIFDVNFSVGVENVPQFLVDMYFDVDAVRPMSVIGMPFS